MLNMNREIQFLKQYSILSQRFIRSQMVFSLCPDHLSATLELHSGRRRKSLMTHHTWRDVTYLSANQLLCLGGKIDYDCWQFAVMWVSYAMKVIDAGCPAERLWLELLSTCLVALSSPVNNSFTSLKCGGPSLICTCTSTYALGVLYWIH